MIDCPCGDRMEFKVSRFGPYYRCRRWPMCDYKVSAHRTGPKKDQPFGTPATSKLRDLRVRAHEAFDTIWNIHEDARVRGGARAEAYRWLARRLELTEETCHIGMFTEEQCLQVIEICGNTCPNP